MDKKLKLRLSLVYSIVLFVFLFFYLNDAYNLVSSQFIKILNWTQFDLKYPSFMLLNLNFAALVFVYLMTLFIDEILFWRYKNRYLYFKIFTINFCITTLITILVLFLVSLFLGKFCGFSLTKSWHFGPQTMQSLSVIVYICIIYQSCEKTRKMMKGNEKNREVEKNGEVND